MAIEDLIAAGVRPPQIDDPSAIALRAMQMRDMQQRAAYQGQLAQLAGVHIQQAQQDQADDMAMRQALGQTNGNIDQALPMLAGRISAARYTGLQNTWLQQQRDKLANTKSLDALQDQYHDSLGDLANGVKAAGYTPESFEAAAQMAQHLHPGMADLLNPYLAQARQDPSTIQRMTDQWIAETASGRAGEAQIRAQAGEQRAEQAEDRAAELQPFKVSQAASEATEAAQKAAGTTPITPYQQKMLDIDKNRDQEMSWYRRQEVAQGWARQQGDGGGETPNSRAVTHRQEMKQLNDLVDQEADLHKLRLQLGNAISNGGVYVDEKGNLKPMDAASASNDQTKAALTQDMRDRFAAATSQVNDVIARKNALGAQLGMTPRVSTEQAAAAVSRGARNVGQPGAQPSAQPAAAPKMTGRRIRVQLQDGRRGSIDSSEFDPKTMKQL